MDETTDLTSELDRLSLTNALLDFEVANARVTDLTQRLIDAANEIGALRAELDRRRIEYEELHKLRVSKIYRIVKEIERVRRIISRR